MQTLRGARIIDLPKTLDRRGNLSVIEELKNHGQVTRPMMGIRVIGEISKEKANLSFTTEKMINPYSWLYNNNGLLMADTSIHIDTNLAKCFTSEIVGASRYLQNKTILLNELNYPPVAYESGYQNNLKCE